MAQLHVPPSPFALSPTKLRDLDCPRRYRLLWIDRITERERPETALGSLVHRVAADYLVHLMDSGALRDHDALGRIMERVWLDRDLVPTSMEDEFIELCRFFRDDLTVEPSTIHGVEMRVAFDRSWNRVPFDSAAACHAGIMDLVELGEFGPAAGAKSIRITDWTTGAIGPGAHGVAKDLQARYYALLAWKLFDGIAAVGYRLVSLRTGRTIESWLGNEDHDETLDRLGAAGVRLQRLAADHGDEPWPAIPGSRCAVCALECPEATAAWAREQPVRCLDLREAEWVLGQLTLVARRREQLLEALRGWARANGPVYSNGMVAGYFPGQSRSYSWERLAPVLEAAQVDVRDCAKFDLAAFKRLLPRARRAELAMQAQQTAELEIVERWSVKPSGGGGEDQ
jgi:hypothetical protein